jgi:hypothetical protein
LICIKLIVETTVAMTVRKLASVVVVPVAFEAWYISSSRAMTGPNICGKSQGT